MNAGGILFRTLGASGLLALLVAGSFAVLFVSIDRMRGAANLSRHSQAVLSAANRLERLAIDLETGERGYLITGDQRFLQPWIAARAAIPRVGRELQGLTQVPVQRRRALRINTAIRSYIRDYSAPLIRAERRNGRRVREESALIEGKRRVDMVRRDFNALFDTERRLGEERQDDAVDAARRVAIASMAGLGGSVLFVLLFATYLARSILRPVSRAAGMADELAGGDLSVRMPETGPGEVGQLERSFNTMAHSLEQSRDELRLLAEEQAALRRVATLVARRATPGEVFDAVTREVGDLLGAPSTRLMRYEPDGTATVVAGESLPGVEIPVGTNMSLEGENISATVLRTGRAARMDSFETASGPLAELLRKVGVQAAVGAPVSVEGRLWGVMIASWTEQQALEGAEARMTQFTELVATAIANAESRAELAASRVRIVAAADESRRRIERDLHDGAQQRLISLGLDLRGVQEAVPPELTTLKSRLAELSDGMTAVIEELQEFARGIHPAILAHGGLRSAVANLARRSRIPVELDVRTERRRFAQQVEVAAYYVVSEALTNAAKHSQASLVRVELDADDDHLRLAISDDGVGGAAPGAGSGLIGLRDRVEALGGQLELESPTGAGTSLRVRIPTVPPITTSDELSDGRSGSVQRS